MSGFLKISSLNSILLQYQISGEGVGNQGKSHSLIGSTDVPDIRNHLYAILSTDISLSLCHLISGSPYQLHFIIKGMKIILQPSRFSGVLITAPGLRFQQYRLRKATGTSII